MKKAYFLVTIGLVAASLVGCNRGWPGCFGRGLQYQAPDTYETYDEPCAECGGYHGDAGAEWVPVAPGTGGALPAVPPESTGASSEG